MIAIRAAPRIASASALGGFALLLALWGNAASVLIGPTATLPGGSGAFALAGLALGAISLGTARALGLDRSAAGLRGAPIRDVLGALTIGAALATLGVLALDVLAPPIVGGRVTYDPLEDADLTGILRHMLLFLPLGVVLPEELAFRGVLLGALAQQTSRRRAIALSAMAFALWHGVVVFTTVDHTTLAGSPWAVVAIPVALGLVGVGGAALAWLRLKTGSISTTVAMHWGFDAVVIAGLWLGT